MIKIPKKPSSNNSSQDKLGCLGISPRLAIYAVAFFVLYVISPIYLTFRLKLPFPILFIYLVVSAFILLLMLHSRQARRNSFTLENQVLEEKINTLTYDINNIQKAKPHLLRKLSRYQELKSAVEKINRELSLEYVVNTLIGIGFELIADKKGVARLYLIDGTAVRPKLSASRKEFDAMVIKAKEGDIFDYWVLKHSQPLFIGDIKNDFRFDKEKLKSQELYPVSSLIAAPFVSEERILGILRLDCPEPDFYNQDDLGILATLCDLGAVALENVQLYSRTKELAIHDGLTLLYTKGYFLERLKEELGRSIRSRLNLSLLMMDIDHFKDYNDTYGHMAGDIILKKIGVSLAEFFQGANGVVCRFGGEEFAVLLPDTDKEKALKLAEGIRCGIQAEKVVIRRKETHVTISVGVTSLASGVIEEDELIRKADAALYEAKQKGRNRVCYS